MLGSLAEESRPECPRDVLEKWIETKCLISKEKQDWRVGRELLQERQDLAQREIASLKEKTQQARSDMTEADKKLEELRVKNAELKESTAGLVDEVAGLEKRLLAFLGRAPAPIAERVKPLSQRIPRPGTETTMSLSERFQNLIGILNEVDKFSRELSVVSEVRELEDGTSAEVTVMYIGLGAAYYTNGKGLAGVGQPGEKGWQWVRNNELYQAVADIIAIQRNEKPAGYVSLPFQVQ